MPAVSKAQRKWAFGTKGADWAKAHGFDNKGKLPARVKSGKPVKAKRKPAKKKVSRRAAPRKRK